MLDSTTIGLRFFDRVQAQILSIPAFRRTIPPTEGEATGIDALSSTRLRDLGFEADQVGGRIDHAKAQHHRFL